MSFDFPSSPTNGQVFAPSGGPVYVYTGGVWRMQGSGQVVTAEARNRIVNGAMQVSQENGNTPVAVGTAYAADQWVSFNASNATVFSQRFQVTTPNRSRDRVRYTVTPADTSLAAGELFQVFQYIEGIRIADFGWGTANAKQVVLRFGWRSPAGTYGISIKNGATNRTWLATFTISAGQAGTDTEQIFVIPGDTTGTWPTDNTAGLMLAFGIAGGTTYQGVAGWQAGNFMVTAACSNGLGVANNAFDLFDVGLYLDPNATGLPPPWQMPDEAQELLACQRYYAKLIMNLAATANAVAWVHATSYPYPVQMRTTPALATAGDGSVSNASAASFDSANGVISCRHYIQSAAAGAYQVLARTGTANARM